nr:AAA family ATPase [Pedobacter kyonggii]
MEPIFKSKPFIEWTKEASLKPNAKMLFSEFWFEGELCILYADTNIGKSILATQIGESISSGIPIKGFIIEAVSQKVLYFDFEMSDVQLKNRYSNINSLYQFNSNFLRTEINSENVSMINEGSIIESLEHEIMSQKASTIIIDNITYLIQDNEKAKFALSLMKELKELKRKHNLSILILAHTPKRDFNRPISNNDLQGSKMLINFCDSAFAIGQSYSNVKLRYIKQIKQRNCERIYDEGNICLCTVDKGVSDDFLQFSFLEFDNEMNHLNIIKDLNYETKILEAKTLKSNGMTNQQIADLQGISEAGVRKRLKKN